MKYSIESRFTFEAGHVLKKAYMSACSENLHGHGYALYVKVTTEKLNEDGMVVDFKKLKESIQPLVDLLDHSFLIAKDDKRLKEVQKSSKKVVILKEDFFKSFDYNPTAEAIAAYIYATLKSTLPLELGVISKDFTLEVKLYETEKNCVIIGE